MKSIKSYFLRKFLIIAFLFSSFLGFTQENESNLTKYTPAILFQSGQWELNLFHNLYTQNQTRDRYGNEVELGERQTFLNLIYQFTYGISKRFNLGIDLNINRSYYGNSNESSLNIFSKGGDFSRTVVSSIGLRSKFIPFMNVSNFSIQSTFLIPVGNNLESPKFVAHDRYTWFTQFLFDQKISNHWRIFFETDFLYRIKGTELQTNFFRTPLGAFLSYFPNNKSSVFMYGQYSPRFQNVINSVDKKFGLASWFFQIGVGAKYQLSNRIGIEVSYSNFVASKEDGAGHSVNFGFRYIK